MKVISFMKKWEERWRKLNEDLRSMNCGPSCMYCPLCDRCLTCGECKCDKARYKLRVDLPN